MYEDERTDNEFAEMLSGIEESMPGPSKEFSDNLLQDLRQSFETSASPEPELIIEQPDATVIPLFEPNLVQTEDQSEGNPRSGNSLWLIAAAVSLIALLTGGAYFLSTATDGTPVAAEDPEGAGVSVPVTDPSVPSTSQAPPQDLDFASSVGFTEVTTSSLELTFTPTADTQYNATLRSGDEVVATTSGSASAGAPATVRFGGLDRSAVYSAEVTLLGQSNVVSPRIEVRTAGEITPIEISGLEFAGATSTTATVRLNTNLCAKASLVILSAVDQSEVQRIASDADAECSTDHQIEIGASVPLEPSTTYLVIAEAVADGDRGATDQINLTSESFTIETESQ